MLETRLKRSAKKLLASSPAWLAAACLLASAVGCDADRLQNFGTFAGLGSAYITAFHGLTKAAGDAVVANSNATMILARTEAGDPVAAGATLLPLVQHDAVVTRNYLVTLQKLDAQADLLGSYFAAIAALTDGKQTDAIGASTGSLVDALKTVAPQIENLKLGGESIASHLPDATKLVVAHFEVRALDGRLEADAPVIDHALALQEAAVVALSTQLAGTLKDSTQMAQTTQVDEPYTSPGALPASWSANRERLIRNAVALQNADDAKTASIKLRTSFEDLVANKNAPLDAKGLLDSIAKMNNFTSAVDSSKTPAN